MPYIGVSPQFGVRRKHTYTAIAGQTIFTGAGSEGATLSYTDSNFVDVYQNGVKLGDADYTSTSGTQIVLTQAASVDDLVEIIVFDAFSAADTVSKADGGTFDGNVTMGGTLGVTGAATLSSTLAVTGDATFDTSTLKVDASNNRVGIGTASPSVPLDIGDNDSGSAGTTGIQIQNSQAFATAYDQTNSNTWAGIQTVNHDDTSTQTGTGLIFVHRSSGSGIAAIQSTSSASDRADIRFITRGSDGIKERMRIANKGFLRASPDNTVTNSRLSATTAHVFHSHTDGSIMFFLENTQADPYGMMFDFSQASPDDNTNFFMKFEDSTAERAHIYTDGDMRNHDGTFSQYSDIRIKQNITDANSQWDDIKAIRFINYKAKDDVRQYGEDKAKIQLGVIAQEMEKISPKLIKEYSPSKADVKSSSEFGTLYEEGDNIPDDKTVGDVKEVKDKVKGIAYSILYMKAVKALQEAMTRIEKLEAEVKALKGE